MSVPGIVISSGIVFSSKSINVATSISAIRIAWLMNSWWSIAAPGGATPANRGASFPDACHQYSAGSPMAQQSSISSGRIQNSRP